MCYNELPLPESSDARAPGSSTGVDKSAGASDPRCHADGQVQGPLGIELKIESNFAMVAKGHACMDEVGAPATTHTCCRAAFSFSGHALGIDIADF